MIEIFMLYLSIPSRINFPQLGRYSLFGEHRFRHLQRLGLTFSPLIRLCLHLGLAHAMPLPSILASSISPVSKLRDDADLSYLSKKPRTGKKRQTQKIWRKG
jgi:hypothetical protein